MRLAVLAAAFLAASPAFAEHSHGDKGNVVESQPTDHCGLPAGEGRIAALNVSISRITIARETADAPGWEKVEEFEAARSVDLAAFAPGDRAHFLIAPEKKGKPAVIVAMCAADAEAAAHEACMASMHKAAMKAAAAQGKECAGAGHDAHQGHGDQKKTGGHSGHH